MTARKSLADDKALVAVQKIVEAMPMFAQYIYDAGEDNHQVALLELPYESEVAIYLNEIGKIVEDEQFVQEVFSESLGILDEMQFDNREDIVYDNMVETLLSRVGKSDNKKEE